MARKSLGDMSGIASTIARSGPAKDRPARSGAPALGALQGSLSAIREIDPALVDDWGPTDRLDPLTAVSTPEEEDGLEGLRASIAEGGQQVPILVRRAPTDGRFQVIYGRRRLQACRELGIKVRANVQDLSDDAALLAKGLENAARRNLSFYERARFAAVIQRLGYDNTTARKVLGLTRSYLSHLQKIATYIPDSIGDRIGAAPKSGRPKWMALAEAFQHEKVTEERLHAILDRADPELTSDERLNHVVREVSRRVARPAQTLEIQPMEGVTIRSGRGSVTLSVAKTGENAAFGTWLDENLARIVEESFEVFTTVNTPEEN
ncbi:plasmid partitioning protein RepB [Sagittula salina]|uniref:Plasmid partitioning protein RepB n=1 Tax=Sagittula salina TaxID=2820268 RepID=A0A940S2M3_9RHOB|nr:plasmid partitioning protein RepB [Sagittula salina]MBP0482149.1 plasmid partitioning protein RepB [Sagittula salina]